METIFVNEDKLKAVIEKAVERLKEAPYQHESNGDYVKIWVEDSGDLDYGVLNGSSYVPGTHGILEFPYTHPDYDSQQYYDEAGGEEETNQTLSEWDWTNFTESSDFSNYCEELLDKIKTNLYERFEQERGAPIIEIE